MLRKAYELEISSEDSKPWPESLALEDAEQCRREVTYMLIWGWATFIATATDFYFFYFFKALTYLYV